MAVTLADVATLAEDPAFIARVRSAMIRAAVNINSSPDDGSTYQLYRHALAKNVVLDQINYAARFAWLVASRTPPAHPVDIVSGSSDSDIQDATDAVWDAMAGAGPVPV